jgi:6,7-dimethyl-8-ribityllumazine synthase
MRAGAPHILIVKSPYYEKICDELARGAVAELEAQGATHETVSVFGAFEIPAAIAMASEAVDPSGEPRFDGFLALGCVIRGETSHYDYVCGESARGLMDLSIQAGLAIGYGILTCETGEQAWERAAVDKKNKGKDAAAACLRMIGLRIELGLDPSGETL